MQNGGKATSLTRLQKGGFRVPHFFHCDETWTETQILQKIRIEFPNSNYFAVRSSAENEDSKDKSFAGHFYSAVGVSPEHVFAEVLKVRKSFNGMPGTVIIQDFIPSDVAGVMFSEVGEGCFVINAIQGLCVPVVNGDICDEYVFNRDGELLDKTIPSNKVARFFSLGTTISRVQSAPSLDAQKIKELITAARSIQRFFGSPQDIEWCFFEEKLYILQSRPITKDLTVGKKEYFDSANIAESYSGTVLPLTYSFAQLVYEQVYRDLLCMSGVSKKKINRHEDVFKNLLGHFYGRMYYNMNNWYQMAAFVPGYRRNKENFELMITSNVRESVSTDISPSLGLKISYPFLVVVKVALFGLTSAYFKVVVKNKLEKLRARTFSGLTYEECITLFRELNNKLLRRWYVTIENDFFVMTYLGLLKKLLDDASLQKLIRFQSKATEQTHALTELSSKIRAIQPLWEAVQAHDAASFEHILDNNQHIRALLNAYLNTFGGRFANELKLESVGVDEDITKLFAVLKMYADYVPSQYECSSQIPLPLFKKIFVTFCLNKFKKYAARREEFRLLRSNTFAVARRLFRQMGDLLAQKGILKNHDDIFYLYLDEVLNQTLHNQASISVIIEQRKEDYMAYKNVKPPAHFVTSQRAWPSTSDSEVPVLNQGRPASPGVVRGRVGIFKEFSMPEKIDFDILVTSHTDPGWTSLIALSKGLIIEHGGVLSHASIVARELGIPAVIGVAQAVDYLKDGQIVEIDGTTGSIKII